MTRTQTVRQNLQLSIDPSPYSNHVHATSSASTPSSTDGRGYFDTSASSPTSTASYGTTKFSVLCLFDFDSEDPDHLSFRKNELLEIVAQEERGWWAAMRRGGNVVGWIPEAFVRVLSDEMAGRLLHVREELRVFEHDAEQLYQTAPISHLLDLEDKSSPYSELETQPLQVQTPPSPMTPLPKPPAYTVTAERSSSLRHKPSRTFTPLRRNTEPTRHAHTPEPATRPVPILEPTTPERKRLAIIKKLTGSDEAVGYMTTVNSPCYVKPRYPDQLKYDPEGAVRAGTVDALVEKLTMDTSKDAINQEFRRIFLTTFRTFMTADKLFEMLVEIYALDYSEDPAGETTDWRDKACLPTQKMVMEVFGDWLEHHRLLEEEPHISHRLTTFLNGIPKTNIMAGTAKVILQTIERLTFASPCIESPGLSTRRRKKSRDHKGDLLRLDPTDLAEQLCSYEHRLYQRITPQECLEVATTRRPEGGARHLYAFTSTHDKLANWVMASILNQEALAKRADTIDFWIKVADKLRSLQNFSSMSAIITALSSVVVTRLQLTWGHVAKKRDLDALLRYNDPTGGFAVCRGAQQQAKGPCVPFVGMYLTDIVRVQDQYEEEDPSWVLFIKRQRWCDIITTILKHQPNAYGIPESPSTAQFVSSSLQTAGSKEQAWFWSKSQEVQATELVHADIRRGLEAAGF
ncbi:ras GEF [Cylindrobasidium torrendii FP15055 ss-10]|uniref:Ras GEF n=1 Tax=Cylindrobasidium torrendii FP15055 ss-10 TaxID=1314674 RepID=A0A0D7BUZ8_9AGAR|nr:ras GEF [Cylindrobasidium torrendii FP15055 ss-10]